MMRRIAGMSALLMPFVCSAQAQMPEADWCRNGLFPREQENLSLGVVQGRQGEKVHFFDDSDACPSKGAACKRAAYLVPGDEVLTGKSTGDWTCVWYQGRTREFVSWVPRKNIANRPAAPIHPVRDWVGRWSNGVSTIRITSSRTGGALRMSSSLRWEGGASPNGEPILHFGGITGALRVQGAKASAAKDDCRVALTRIGNYLVADDNGSCGGMNVRHTDVYVRRPR